MRIASIHPHLFEIHTSDQPLFTIIGQSVADSNGFRKISYPGEPEETSKPPGYYILLGFIIMLSGSLDLILLKIFSVISGIFLVAAVFLLGKRIFDEKVGLISSLLTAFNYYLFYYSHVIQPEIIFSFASLLVFYHLARFAQRDKNYKFFAISCFFSINSFMLRKIGIWLVFSILATLLFVYKEKIRHLPKYLVGISIIITILFFAFWKPIMRFIYAIGYNLFVLGYFWFFYHFFYEILLAIEQGNNLITENGIYRLILYVYILPAITIGGWVFNSFSSYFFILNFALGVLLLVPGVIKSLRYEDRYNIIPISVYSIFYLLSLALWPWGFTERYLIPLIPLLIPYCSLTLFSTKKLFFPIKKIHLFNLFYSKGRHTRA